VPFVVGWRSGVKKQDSRRARLARAAQAIMDAAPGDRHSLRTLACRLGVSSYHLAHVFRAEMGTSVHQYLLQRRLTLARDRLAQGVTSLSALALDLGFSTHSHFTAAFRRRFGITPREARLVLSQFEDGQVNGVRAGLPPAA
jgi:AraC-like DNA-binding protein